MKTKPASKAAVDEDEEKPKKTRSSRGKSRRVRRSRSLSGSVSPPRKRSSKSSKRIADKKSKKSKAGSRRRHRSPSPSRSLSSSSLSSARRRSRSAAGSGSSASERSVSPPPRSRSRDVRKRKGRDRDRKRRKGRRSTSCSSSSAASSDSSRSRSRSKNRKRRAAGTKDGTARDKTEKDYRSRHASRSEKNMTDDVDRVEEELATAKMGNSKIDGYEKNVSLEKVENPPSKDAHETEDILPAASGSPVAEDLELILRQKALENFRKFRAAAAMAGKTDNGATGKEALSDSPQDAGTKMAEARSAAVTPFQRQGIALGVRHSAGSGSPRSEDCENGTSHSWKRESSAGMSLGAGSPGILEAGGTGGTGGPTQQKGSMVEATRSTSQLISPQYSRNTGGVMQRLSSIPGSSASVKQSLGSSAGVSHVNGAPRVRSVVSIPDREGLDGSTSTTPPVPCENSAPVENSSQVGHPLIDINKAGGTNGDDRKTSEASASNGSVLSPAEGKSQATEARNEDKDSSEFQKKTFSRMHDGEMVEVSYKVYIPKKTPALARRKLQR